MSKRRKNLIDEVLDRASDIGRDYRTMTRTALTGKKKKKKNTRKMVQRNTQAIEALILQLDRYIKQHEKEKTPSTQ
jgi:hypothetical protein